MNKNPFLNALAALAYIVVVATMTFYANHYASPHDTLLTPIAVLSLFTLSAAVMGYLFLGEPVQLYLDGKKKEAVSLFSRTVSVFAVLTVIMLLGVFFVSRV